MGDDGPCDATELGPRLVAPAPFVEMIASFPELLKVILQSLFEIIEGDDQPLKASKFSVDTALNLFLVCKQWQNCTRQLSLFSSMRLRLYQRGPPLSILAKLKLPFKLRFGFLPPKRKMYRLQALQQFRQLSHLSVGPGKEYPEKAILLAQFAGLTQFANLKELKLKSVKPSKEIALLQNLETLSIRSHPSRPIEGCTWINQLTNLKKLTLIETPLPQIRLPKLHQLTYWHTNGWKNPILILCPVLQSLDVSCVANLPDLYSVKVLRLWHNSGIRAIENLKRLKILSLPRLAFAIQEDPQLIGSLTELLSPLRVSFIELSSPADSFLFSELELTVFCCIKTLKGLIVDQRYVTDRQLGPLISKTDLLLHHSSEKKLVKLESLLDFVSTGAVAWEQKNE